MKSIIFATNNKNKVDEIRSVLSNSFQIISLSEAGINIEIPEPFETLEENTSNKLIKVRLLIDNVETSTGIDFIKKKAEQIAAQKACEQLKL